MSVLQFSSSEDVQFPSGTSFCPIKIDTDHILTKQDDSLSVGCRVTEDTCVAGVIIILGRKGITRQQLLDGEYSIKKGKGSCPVFKEGKCYYNATYRKESRGECPNLKYLK